MSPPPASAPAEPSDPCDVLIVGGGFTGTSLACALSDGARRITVLEARRGPRPTFAGELIHPTGVEVLDRLGLRGPLERAGAARIDGFAVYRMAAREPEVLLPYQGAPGVRTTGLAIDHGVMVEALRGEAAVRIGVDLRLGVRAEAVLREGGRVVGVRTGDGAELRARLVLSAEGRHSRLRDDLGIAVEARLISFTAALRVPGARLPHPAFGHIFLGAPGPILAYPIGGGDARMCFDLPDSVRPEELRRLLLSRYAPLLPAALFDDVHRALLTDQAQLIATHGMRTEAAVKDGMAIVGDVGGCAHPLTAGGMTLCLNDVSLLERALDGSAEIAPALLRYQRERTAMLQTRVALTDALYDIFTGAEDGERSLRDGIFRYWQSPRARRASVALLAGADTRRLSLSAEYARVIARAMQGPASRPLPVVRTALRHARGLLLEGRPASPPAAR